MASLSTWSSRLRAQVVPEQPLARGTGCVPRVDAFSAVPRYEQTVGNQQVRVPEIYVFDYVN
jgi:hypothetical protein